MKTRKEILENAHDMGGDALVGIVAMMFENPDSLPLKWYEARKIRGIGDIQLKRLMTLGLVDGSEFECLSVRARNCLYASSMKTKSDIKERIELGKVRPYYKMKCRNLGIKTYLELCKFVGVEIDK